MATNTDDSRPTLTHANDPLWKLRHALAGVGLAVLASVPLAALLARWAGDAVADRYALRVAIYSALLLYVLAGAGVLFARVARHETRPLSPQRALLWLTSMWLWPLLLVGRLRSGA
jgi:hypothetical protein